MTVFFRTLIVCIAVFLLEDLWAQPPDPPPVPDPRGTIQLNWKDFKEIRQQLDSLKNLERQFSKMEIDAEIMMLEGKAAELTARGNAEEAERLYTEVLRHYERAGDSLNVARIHNQIASEYNRRGNYEKARQHWKEASAATRHMVVVKVPGFAIKPDSLFDAYWFDYSPAGAFTINIEKETKPTENKAEAAYQQLLAEKEAAERSRKQDSLTNALILQEQAQKLEILRQEKEIKSLELARERASFERQQTYQYALLGGLGLAIVLLGLLTVLFLTKRNAHRRLQAVHENLKSAQAKLVASEKMASLGQLTAGIAHEINNPINYVAGNIVPLKRDLQELKEWVERYRRLPREKDPTHLREAFAELDARLDWNLTLEEINHLLQGIEEGALRTKEIVLGLRNFSRVDENDFKLADLHMGIDSTLTLLNNKFRHKVTVHKDYGEIPQIECLPGKLNQVFMNLFTNAEQAMEGEGEIFIQTRLVKQGADPHFPQRHVRIAIRDTGPGMPKEVRDRVFEPFFTTKPVGKGTGLGLSITYGIVQDHGGRIEVFSEPGKGTEFMLTLPIENKGHT